MKYLLPLLLGCMLLCGCGRNAFPEETLTAIPTESLVGEPSEPEAYGGTVQKIPLNLTQVQGLRVFQGKLLLFSGQEHTTLTLIDPEDMDQAGSLTLEFFLDPALVRQEADTLSFFDPNTRDLVVLDAGLTQLRRITAPGGSVGAPILCGNTLYYCTSSQVQAWDLNTGIRRRIKEMRYASQVLTGVLLDGAVLQCQVTEGDALKTLFLSSRDGRLLQEITGTCSIHTEGSRYYASLPSGGYRLNLFGGPEPAMLLPEDPTGACYFLPSLHGAVVSSADKLHYYTLSTGLRRNALNLEAGSSLTSMDALDEGTLILLTYDSVQDQEMLILWDIRPGSPTEILDSRCYTASYGHDPEALRACRQQANTLAELYGIRILLGEDAVAEAPWSHSLEPEHLAPLIRQELALLKRRLEQYPQEILAETAAHFSSLNLCLVRSAAGPGCCTLFLRDTNAYVVIPVGSAGEQALYHGLFHAMETHIFGESLAFDQWETLNPAGFQYDCSYSANAARDSGVYLFQEIRAFVDTFSMSYPREDRARIFEYAMLPDQQELFLPKKMQAKLKAVCQGIRDAYDLEGQYPWEQYLE